MPTAAPHRRLLVALVVLAASALLALAVPLWAANAPAGSAGAALADEVQQADGLLISNGDEANRTVKAGVFAFDGYHMKDENGELYGYGIEVLEMISKYSHLNFDLVGYDSSWNDMLSMLESGEIDVVTSAAKTPDREAMFDYSLPIGVKSTVLFLPMGSE